MLISPSSLPPSASIHSNFAWGTSPSWMHTILVGLAIKSPALLWLMIWYMPQGWPSKCSYHGHWILSGLTRAVAAHSQQLQHLKLRSFQSRRLRTAWLPPFPELLSLFFNFVCKLYFQYISFLNELDIFLVAHNQGTQNNTKTFSHGPALWISAKSQGDTG